MEANENPIVQLAEFVQRNFGKNIETRVINKIGPDHMPIVTVEIELPDGHIYQASGNNKRIAKQKAAEMAIKELQ